MSEKTTSEGLCVFSKLTSQINGGKRILNQDSLTHIHVISTSSKEKSKICFVIFPSQL